MSLSIKEHLDFLFNTHLQINSYVESLSNYCFQLGFLQWNTQQRNVIILSQLRAPLVQLNGETPIWAITADKIKTIGVLAFFSGCAYAIGKWCMYGQVYWLKSGFVVFVIPPALLIFSISLGLALKGISCLHQTTRQNYQTAIRMFETTIKIQANRRIRLNTFANMSLNILRGVSRRLNLAVYKNWLAMKGKDFSNLEQANQELNRVLIDRRFILIQPYPAEEAQAFRLRPQDYVKYSLRPEDVREQLDGLNPLDYLKRTYKERYGNFLTILCSLNPAEFKKLLADENKPIHHPLLNSLDLPPLLKDKKFIKYELLSLLQEVLASPDKFQAYGLDFNLCQNYATRLRSLLLSLSLPPSKNIVTSLALRERQHKPY